MFEEREGRGEVRGGGKEDVEVEKIDMDKVR